MLMEIRRWMVAAALACVAITASWADDPSPSLFLVDGTFSTQQSRIFQVDPASGELQLRADLGTQFTPMLGMAAASAKTIYLSGSDRSPANACQGDIACVLLHVDLDPNSTTPSLVQIVGVITEDGSILAGITGLTFRKDGKLYAISQDTSALYTIDLTTAVATRLASLDIEVHGGDITFDSEDRLWMWTNIGAGDGLYQLDPVTGHASAFDLHPMLDMAGLAAVGHGDQLEGVSQTTNNIYEMNPVVGLTGQSSGLTYLGSPFDLSRGDLDSPFCESDESCADQNSCTSDACDPGGCSHTAVVDGTGCSDGNACTQSDTCHSGTCAPGAPVVCAAPDACHDPGQCDPSSGACVNAPAKPDGTACDDGNPCTRNDSCQAGICVGSSPVVCAATDACHDAGTCNPATGSCVAGSAKPDGTTCNDGNACTLSDSCQAGACVGSSPVVCAATDACHDAGTCNPATGSCVSGSAKPDGTTCNDGNACTLGDFCLAGVCHGGALPDLDGDSHIDALCGGDDCSDSDPLVWSAPPEVANLSLAADTSTVLTWDNEDLVAGPETTFDLSSGGLSEVAGFSLSGGTCLQGSGGNLFTDLRADPSVGAGFWYLVRARNSCGVGTLGSSNRDSTVVSCP